MHVVYLRYARQNGLGCRRHIYDRLDRFTVFVHVDHRCFILVLRAHVENTRSVDYYLLGTY